MPEVPLIIDGGMDEGGGQIVRMAAALSACTGRPVEMIRIRAKRPLPGLAAQHCAAVEAVARACGARLNGCKKGSSHLSFFPGRIRTLEIDLDIGSAGSIPLVMQAWLPVAMHEGGTLTVTGGTEVRMSPPIDYLEHVFLPVLRHAGADITVDVLARGYYPRGGGRVRITVEQSRLSPISIPAVDDRWGICSCSSNLPTHVTERQARRAAEVLQEAGAAGCSIYLDQRTGPGTGSSCTVWHGAGRERPRGTWGPC
jgi:RNA 3'-terminal phosphate cyclase (ATP)